MDRLDKSCLGYYHLSRAFMKKYLFRMLVPLPAIAFALAIFTGPWLLHPLDAVESGCVNCHTNEKLLKSLHSPVKVEISEGVG